MRKIVGYFQISIFLVCGLWLISFKFDPATYYNAVYWIAGVLYLLLAGVFLLLGRKYGWYSEVKDKASHKKGNTSNFTIPFVFAIGLFSLLRSSKEVLNIDSVTPFIVLLIPLASILGYVGYLAQSSMRPSQFLGSFYKKALVPMLYIGSFCLAFSLLISANDSLPATYNESRTYELANNDCTSDSVSIITKSGPRTLYNARQSMSDNCAGAKRLKVKLKINTLGIDYFTDFEYLK